MKLILKNWPPFRDCELTLPRFAVIVGQNGVGKSQLLDAIYGNNGNSMSRRPTELADIVGMMPTKEGALLVECVEAKLHPKRYPERVAQIRALLEKHPLVSVICTCYAPYFVDNVALDEVLVVASNGKESACKFLSEHPNAGRCTVELSTGEFWSSVGEEWVLK